jgi:hypothetical protein
MIRSRRAVSIVELLVVMSASTLVLTLTSVMIVRAMRVQMQSRAYCDIERNSLRLAEQFRRDVHQAQAVPKLGDAEDEEFLRLQPVDGGQVTYRMERSSDGGTVLRLRSTSGKPDSREEFVFPATCELAIQELQSPQRLALTITSATEVAAGADGKPRVNTALIPVSFRVEAVVGRDSALASAAGAEEVAP